MSSVSYLLCSQFLNNFGVIKACAVLRLKTNKQTKTWGFPNGLMIHGPKAFAYCGWSQPPPRNPLALLFEHLMITYSFITLKRSK